MGHAGVSNAVTFVGANIDAGDVIPETDGVRKLRWAIEGRGKRSEARVIYYFHSEAVPLFLLTVLWEEPESESHEGGAKRVQESAPAPRDGLWQRQEAMKRRVAPKKTGRRRSVGQEVITSLKEAIAWAGGEDVPVRVTAVEVPATDVRAVRRKLGLSQSKFAAKFGFQSATLKNWEQGRTRPDGPARVLLAVIARHPEAVEDALRKAG